MISFGPAGCGGLKEIIPNLEKYQVSGLRACEIPFTYQIWIKPEQAVWIKEEMKQRNLSIRLSIHAPYWINLNSAEKEKIEQGKKRIIDCCRIGELMGAERVVFHAGFYGKKDKEESYQNIKRAIVDILDEIKKNKWKIKISPETMGKTGIFGSAEEILRLVKETGCDFCVDFAHLWAREQGRVSYEEIYFRFKEFDSLHCHFSGIVFGDKGEKSHKPTPDEEIEKLLKALPKNKDILIINEAPDPVGDSLRMLEIFEKFS
jgi:deoxyribonuclease-4